MNGARSSVLRIGFVALMTALLLTAAGCSAISKDQKAADSPPSAQKGRSDQTEPVYLDFDDVLIPGEMSIDRNESFVYQTSGLTVGSISVKGRVELSSLIDFFEKNMPRDNWQLVSEFKSPPRTMMLFQKQNRWCVVEISEGTYNTYAKIWVSPTVGQSSGGLVR